MNVDRLIAMLAERRITLRLDEGSLKYRAPTGALTLDLKEAISRDRLRIIDRLTSSPERKAQNKTSCIHVFPKNWIDQPAENGTIRTTCRLCGRFIGYRT